MRGLRQRVRSVRVYLTITALFSGTHVKSVWLGLSGLNSKTSAVKQHRLINHDPRYLEDPIQVAEYSLYLMQNFCLDDRCRNFIGEHWPAMHWMAMEKWANLLYLTNNVNISPKVHDPRGGMFSGVCLHWGRAYSQTTNELIDESNG